MLVHYDFMKKGFRGRAFRSSLFWEEKELTLGHYIGFYKYAYMFCLNAYMRLRVHLQRKGEAITFQVSRIK